MLFLGSKCSFKMWQEIFQHDLKNAAFWIKKHQRLLALKDPCHRYSMLAGNGKGRRKCGNRCGKGDNSFCGTTLVPAKSTSPMLPWISFPWNPLLNGSVVKMEMLVCIQFLISNGSFLIVWHGNFLCPTNVCLILFILAFLDQMNKLLSSFFGISGGPQTPSHISFFHNPKRQCT